VKTSAGGILPKLKPRKPARRKHPKYQTDYILRCRGIEVVDDKGNVLLSVFAFTEKERLESVGGPVFAGIAFHDTWKRGDITSSFTNQDAEQLLNGGAE